MHIILSFETEARMLFGVVFMDKLFETNARDFALERDRIWNTQLPPEIKAQFIHLAQYGKFDGPLPETPGFEKCVSANDIWSSK